MINNIYIKTLILNLYKDNEIYQNFLHLWMDLKRRF